MGRRNRGKLPQTKQTTTGSRLRCHRCRYEFIGSRKLAGVRCRCTGCHGRMVVADD
jgi:predicted SprT family Zn-dependent metalloprotease